MYDPILLFIIISIEASYLQCAFETEHEAKTEQLYSP